MIRKILNSFALAFGNIRSNMFHTALSVLGIVIGVGALVSILSLIDGMERYAREQISTTTPVNTIIIRTELFRTMNNVRIRKDSAAVLTYDAFHELHKRLSRPSIQYYRFSGSGSVTMAGGEMMIGTSLFGVDTTLTPDAKLWKGSKFTAEDLDAGRHVAIVNKAFLKEAKLDSSTEPIGREIRFRDWRLKITGILADERNNAPQVYFPVTLIDSRELGENPADAAFEVTHTEDIPLLRSEIDSWIKSRYGRRADDFRIITNEFRVEQITKGFLLFRIIMGMIVGISVIVGGIGVMNVLLISVTERTSEIGIRKAMGANRRDIIFLFLSESIAVSAFGSLLGVIFGVVFTVAAIPIVKALTKVPFQADYTLNTILVISVVSLFVGVVFGTYPALRASRLNPVDAIRHE